MRRPPGHRSASKQPQHHMCWYAGFLGGVAVVGEALYTFAFGRYTGPTVS
jgi:hypothetical protein